MADQSASSSPPPQHVFVYGNSRPDVPGAAEAPQCVQAKRAWLLGSRLYSCKRGGVQSAAVRLDEPGHAVLGYAVPLKSPDGFGGLLDTLERQEFPRDHYERDVVEVITEQGEHLISFVYHCPEVERSSPVSGGDWLLHLKQ